MATCKRGHEGARRSGNGTCTACNAERLRRADLRAAKSRRDRHRMIRRKYGIDAAQYEQLLASQSGRCAVCGTLPKQTMLCVDHDHSTGVIRGLLCYGCNAAIAMLGDTADGVERAVVYLRRADGMA